MKARILVTGEKGAYTGTVYIGRKKIDSMEFATMAVLITWADSIIDKYGSLKQNGEKKDV